MSENEQKKVFRDSVIIYRSFFEAIDSLPTKYQLAAYRSLMEYAFNENELQTIGVVKTVFGLMKPQISANHTRFRNGSKEKNKRNGSETEAKGKQNESESEANNNNNNNVNNNNNNNNNNNADSATAATKFDFKKSLIEKGFQEDLVEAWLKVRKSKKATNTEIALDGFLREIEKSKKDKNEVLRICVERSWSGFENDWITKINGKQPHEIASSATVTRITEKQKW